MELQIASSAGPVALTSTQSTTELTLPEIPRLSTLLQECVARLPEQLVSRWAGGPTRPQNGGEIGTWK